MKVLWIVNATFPEISDKLSLPKVVSQGWLLDLAEIIGKTKDIELFIVTAHLVSELQRIKTETAVHYVMPRRGKFSANHFNASFYAPYLKTIYDEVKPDIVHLHGTENIWGPFFLRKYPQVPALVTIQGVISRISEEYYGGLSIKDVLVNRTIRENIRFRGMLFSKIGLRIQAKVEQEVIRNVKYIIGRTLWDYAVINSINPDINYYLCYYNLRKEFYSAPKWSIDHVERHSIYTSFANYPLKGLHILIKAVSIVKRKYQDVKVYVPGIAADGDAKLIVDSGYKKYINKLINNLDLQSNVVFMGSLSTEKVIEQMLKSNAVVVPSAIEGDSATVCEGMHLGLPCVCAYRGGMTELLQDGITGYYYDYPEYAYLAERIMTVFGDDKLCRKFSDGVVEQAEIRHDRQKNAQCCVDVYRMIFNQEG